MKRKILTIIAVVVLLTGIGFLLFPPISNFIGKLRSEAAAESFDRSASSAVDTVTADDGTVIDNAKDALEHGAQVSDDGKIVNTFANGAQGYGETIVFIKDLNALYADSLAYNEMLLTGQGTEDTTDFTKAALDLIEYGLYDYSYGYVSADSIGMKLPVYLGASYYMMSYGATHLYGTSLPLGNESENCALSGHTDYIGRIFFDNIRYLELGDTVTFTNYWDTIEYEVIDYKVIKPNDADDLVIQRGRTLLTLITCTPDGEGDFDRYIVICEKK